MKSESAVRLRILLLEDNPADAELVLYELRRAGIDAETVRVITREDFEKQLDPCPDAILSDYQLPLWSGLDALRLVRGRGLEVPFIIVSGTIGEDLAVEAMRHGADDYLLKDRLSRLGSALAQALERKRLRDEARKGAEALRESEAGLHRAQFMARLAHVITGPDGSFETWSATLPQLIGVEHAQMPASTREWLDVLHPEDRATFRAKAIEAGVKGVRTDVEYRLRRTAGEWIHVRQVMEPIVGQASPDGKWRWFNTLQDVTEQKRVLEALRASEARHRAMFENAAVGITHTDLDGRFVMVNPKLCEITGYTQEEAPSLTFRDLTHPDDVQKSIELRARLLEGTMAPYEREARLLRKDRSLIWVNITTSLVRAADGAPLHFISVLHDVSERKRMEQAVRAAEANYRAIFENTVEGIFQTSREGRVITVNEAAARMLGYDTPEEAIASLTDVGSQVYVYPEDRQKLLQALESDGFVRGLETRYRRKDGSKIWVSLSARMMSDERGDFLLGTMQDITERRQQQRRIERLSRVYAVLSGINALIVRVRDRDELFREACRIAVDAGRFKFAWVCVVDNEAMELKPVAWVGTEGGFLDQARNRRSLREDAPEEQGLSVQAAREKRAVIVNDVESDPRVRYRREHLERGVRSVAILPLLVGDEVAGTIGLHAGETGFFDDDEMKLLLELAGDISFAIEHIEKSEKVDYLAYYDSLTGLANRTFFHERLTQQLHAAAAGQHKVALLIADVERFKSINDSLGRQAGDLLLKQVAQRLRSYAPDPVEIARVGADQFAIVIPDVKQENDVARFIEQGASSRFGEPFELGGTKLKVRVKVGITLFPNDGTDPDILIRNAEAALDKAKSGGIPYLFFAEEMTQRVAGKLGLELQLQRALEKDEFVLHYQPKVDLESRRIVGVEALIRWMSPERGLVPPGHFIPLLEETGLILEVGAWAIRRAVRDHRHWLRQGVAAPRVAVNVSQIQLRQPDFVDVLREAVQQGENPTGLDLEITESMMMYDIEGNTAKLKAVRDLGLSIAIDDFGTGYSSLGYLAKLPVQALKIDRSFIINMLNDPDTMTLVSTIISLAHSLRLHVIAEGVETEEQAKMLRLLRCDQMQGYLIGRPQPMEELTSLLSAQK